jgi:hypothetical protein
MTSLVQIQQDKNAHAHSGSQLAQAASPHEQTPKKGMLHPFPRTSINGPAEWASRMKWTNPSMPQELPVKSYSAAERAATAQQVSAKQRAWAPLRD